MIGGDSFTGVFRQVFKLSMVSKLNYTKGDIEEMPPFERYAYFDLLEEYNSEMSEQETMEGLQEQQQ